MFTRIAITGTGNIGVWLFNVFQNQHNMIVDFVSGRNIKTLPQDSDLYIFALKDDVYEEVLSQIPFKMSHAVHTSGSLSQNILAPYAMRYGVLYPYQTITEKVEKDAMMRELNDEKIKKSSHLLPFSSFENQGSLYRCEIPVCIEGCCLDFEKKLYQWANSIFSVVHKISEKQRFAIHLAAVFANNFTNAMCGIAYQIFKENNLEWSLIYPLLENTLEKAKYNDPRTVQTGPAKRNDITIMKKHCNALKNEELKILYQLVSKIIADCSI